MKITKDLLKKITSLASKGLNKKDIAIRLGYSYQYFWETMKNNSEMNDAYLLGRVDMKKLLEDRVMLKAMSDDKDSLTAATYLLNRHHPILEEITDIVEDTTDSDARLRLEIIKDLSKV